MNTEAGFRKSRHIGLLIIAGTLFLIGCGGSGASVEEMKELEETKQSALSAEKKIRELKMLRKALSDSLNARRTDLKQVKADKSEVEVRLKEMEEAAQSELEKDTETGKDTTSTAGVEPYRFR